MKNIIGIKIGCCETSASIVISDYVIGNAVFASDLYILREESVISSTICITQSDEVVISPNANQFAKAKEVGINFFGPLVGSLRHSKISDSSLRYLQLFISKTYEAIKENPNNHLHTTQDGTSDYLIYFTCPDDWSPEQIDVYQDFIKTKCNIPIMGIVNESRAVYILTRHTVHGGIRIQASNTLVINFGSNTIDFNYIDDNHSNRPIYVGYKLGARIVEETFLKYLKEHETEANENISLAEKICGQEKGKNILLSEIRMLKEEYFSSPNQDKFLPSIDLKRTLCERSLAGRYIEPSSSDGYSKDDVLNILADYRKKLAYMLDDFFASIGVMSIGKVILIGGASRMFFFKDLVAEKYNVSKENGTLIVDVAPSVTASRSAAIWGYMNEKTKNINVGKYSPLPSTPSTSNRTNSIHYNNFSKIVKKR